MAIVERTDRTKSIAAEILRYTARRYPDVDATTAWQALVLAAADLRAMVRARNWERHWVDAEPPYASANPWQVEYD